MQTQFEGAQRTVNNSMLGTQVHDQLRSDNDGDGQHVTIPSQWPQYAFTLRKTKIKDIDKHHLFEEYEKRIRRIDSLTGCAVQDKYYELTNGLHLHGVLRLRSSFNHKLLRTRGWNLKLKRVYDNGWELYKMKDQPSYRDPDRSIISNISMFR